MPLIELNYAARHKYLRSEEHTSELQSPLNISYAVFCLKKKKNKRISRTGAADYSEIFEALVFLTLLFLLYFSCILVLSFFFFNDTATTEIYTLSDTLSLHDALPISRQRLTATAARRRVDLRR